MFKGEFELIYLCSGLWKLANDFTYENSEILVEAKKGLITDGASIPKAMWSIIGSPLTGRYVESAIIHDALYQSKLLTRKESDSIFLAMMKDSGVSLLRRNAIYYAVRMFGMHSWNKIQTPSTKLCKVTYK